LDFMNTVHSQMIFFYDNENAFRTFLKPSRFEKIKKIVQDNEIVYHHMDPELMFNHYRHIILEIDDAIAEIRRNLKKN
jgi:hypothetical protein